MKEILTVQLTLSFDDLLVGTLCQSNNDHNNKSQVFHFVFRLYCFRLWPNYKRRWNPNFVQDPNVYQGGMVDQEIFREGKKLEILIFTLC